MPFNINISQKDMEHILDDGVLSKLYIDHALWQMKGHINPHNSLFSLLGVRENCTVEEVNYNTRQISMWLHPDKSNRLIEKFCKEILQKRDDLEDLQVELAVDLCRGEVSKWFQGSFQKAVDNLSEQCPAFWNTLKDAVDLDAYNLIDMKRAHDNYLLQWIVAQGFRVLVTDFAPFDLNQQEASLQGVKERLPHADAKQVWLDFWTGKTKLDQLFNQWGQDHPIIFTCPEPSKNISIFMRILQENVLLMHNSGRDFTLGILFNIHRFPLSQKDSEPPHEDLFLGLQICQLPLLDAHLWPIYDKVLVLQSQRQGQFAVGGGMGMFGDCKKVKRSSHYAIAFFTNQNSNAKDMLNNMIMHRELKDWDNPHILAWGTHKTDWKFFSDQWKQHKDHRLLLFRYCHCGFPPLQLQSDPTQVPLDLEADGLVTFRLSMDIPDDDSTWEVGSLIKQQFYHLLPDEFKAEDSKLEVNPVSRKSYGNWSKDKITAWDFTLTGP